MVLPTEVLLIILSHLDWRELWRLRAVSRLFYNLVKVSSLYEKVTIGDLGRRNNNKDKDKILPPPQMLNIILPRTSQLQVHLSRVNSLEPILSRQFNRLKHLDLDHSSFDGFAIHPIETVTSLRARCCHLLRDASMLNYFFPNLKSLDVAWSPVNDISSNWNSLEYVNICGTQIESRPLCQFLKSISSFVISIDCHAIPLDTTYIGILKSLFESQPKYLEYLDIRGWDFLTLNELTHALSAICNNPNDIIPSKLQSNWFFTFNTKFCSRLTINHNVILQSDDENGYRNLIKLLS